MSVYFSFHSFLLSFFGNEINAVNVYSISTAMMIIFSFVIAIVDDNYDDSCYS